MKWSTKVITKVIAPKKAKTKTNKKVDIKKSSSRSVGVKKNRNTNQRSSSPVAASKIQRSKTDALPY